MPAWFLPALIISGVVMVLSGLSAAKHSSGPEDMKENKK